MKISDMLKETPEERFTGDIEMKTISSAKKLGNKTRKSKKSPKTSSPNLSSRNATVSSTSARRLRRTRARNIYTKRVRYSRCRGLSKSICHNKKICKFTKGKSRKYCRKKHNKHI
jgi:hypothetical protein